MTDRTACDLARASRPHAPLQSRRVSNRGPCARSCGRRTASVSRRCTSRTRGPGAAPTPARTAETDGETERGGVDAIVLAHGFTGHLDRPALRRAATAFTEHAAVITFSFRGHGGSGGRSTVGDLEVLDLAAAVAWARSLGHRKVATVGFSMGGSVVLRHGALYGPHAADGHAKSPSTAVAHGGRTGARTSRRRGTGERGPTPAPHSDAVVAVSAPARWYYRGTAPMRRLHWVVQRPLGRLVSRYGLRTRIHPEDWDPVPLPPVAAAPLIAPVPLLSCTATATRTSRSTTPAPSPRRRAPRGASCGWCPVSGTRRTPPRCRCCTGSGTGWVSGSATAHPPVHGHPARGAIMGAAPPTAHAARTARTVRTASAAQRAPRARTAERDPHHGERHDPLLGRGEGRRRYGGGAIRSRHARRGARRAPARRTPSGRSSPGCCGAARSSWTATLSVRASTRRSGSRGRHGRGAPAVRRRVRCDGRPGTVRVRIRRRSHEHGHGDHSPPLPRSSSPGRTTARRRTTGTDTRHTARGIRQRGVRRSRRPDASRRPAGPAGRVRGVRGAARSSYPQQSFEPTYEVTRRHLAPRSTSPRRSRTPTSPRPGRAPVRSLRAHRPAAAASPAQPSTSRTPSPAPALRAAASAAADAQPPQAYEQPQPHPYAQRPQPSPSPRPPQPQPAPAAVAGATDAARRRPGRGSAPGPRSSRRGSSPRPSPPCSPRCWRRRPRWGTCALTGAVVLLQAVTAAGWFRLNGMWPARQGIALAFLAGVAADAGLLLTGGGRAPDRADRRPRHLVRSCPWCCTCAATPAPTSGSTP